MVRKLTKWSYLQPFLFTKESLHLLDISRRLNENHATVRNYLNEFAKEGILKISQKGRLTLYNLNYESPLIIDSLSIVEKENVLEMCSQNKIFSELVSDIHNLLSGPVVIFGSSANSFQGAQDIDIICTENTDFNKLEKKYNKEFHAIKVKELKNIKKALKEEVLKKHLLINCVEECVRWLI